MNPSHQSNARSETSSQSSGHSTLRASVLGGIFLILAVFIFQLTSTPPPASALTTVPTKMNFQGRLTDNTGNIKPNGSYNMRLKLYTVASSGSPVWSEDRLVSAGQGVPVTNGLFSIQLGSLTPLPVSLFASGSLYLEVELASPATATSATPTWSEGPMSPRNQLATSAYAMNAETLDGLDSSDFAAASGSASYIQNGTSPQTASLNITGSGTFGGSLSVGMTVGSSEVLYDGFEDNTLTPFTTSGNAVWSIVTDRKNSGSYAAKSGTITHSQASTLSYSYTSSGDGYMTFSYNTSSEMGCDLLRFYIDGQERAYYSGDTYFGDWRESGPHYFAGAGTHTFEWRYTKDGAATGGEDAVWIDDMHISQYSGAFNPYTSDLQVKGMTESAGFVANLNSGIGTIISTQPQVAQDVLNGAFPAGNSIFLGATSSEDKYKYAVGSYTDDSGAFFGAARTGEYGGFFGLSYGITGGLQGGGSGFDIYDGRADFYSYGYRTVELDENGVNTYNYNAANGQYDLVMNRIGADGRDTYFTGGNVGIGTTSPTKTLDIRGDFLAKSLTNSTSAFMIQNSASGNLFNVDSTNAGNITVFGNDSGEVGSWTTNANALPGLRRGHTSVTANGYVYSMGGTSGVGGYTSTVYYAKLNADGSVGTWQTATNALPSSRAGHTSVTANGYVYVMGGLNITDTAQSTVYYAKLNADGSVGTWQTATNALPAARSSHNSVVANGYVYVMGGSANTVYYAKLNADGTVGAWQTAANALPTSRSSTTSVVANGYVYVMGGSDATVYYAKLNADGTVGTWQTAANMLPGVRSSMTSVVANGRVYVIGGFDGTAWQSTVYYTRLGGTLQLGGSLDLVGLQGGTLADDGGVSGGSTGGSITAGNITAVGALTVQGASSFNGNMAINSTLNVTSENATGYVATINNTNTANTADGLLINLGVANASRGTGNYFIGFAGANTVAGKIQGGASAVVYTTTAADYAEYFRADPSNLPQAGELVTLDATRPGGVRHASGGDLAVGVISTSPGFVGNGPLCQLDDDDCDTNYAKTNVLVSLVGQVPLKVTGEVRIGDALGASATPGVAQVVTDGSVVGYALTASTDGIVQVLIRPGTLNPASGSGIQGGNATVTNLFVTGQATVESLTVTGNARIEGNLAVEGTLETGDIVVNGRIVTQGDAPQIVAGVAAGQYATAPATIKGNSTTGSLYVTSADKNTTPGVLASVAFPSGFYKGHGYTVVVSASNAAASNLRTYVVKTEVGFDIVTNDIPTANTAYSFDYIVLGTQ